MEPKVSMEAKRVIPKWTFADRLRKVRVHHARMTGAEFAKELGVGLSQYMAWESDRNRPRPQLKADIARIIEARWGVPASWLVRDRD
jgi:transcriptional regulator with XRE-family HTH domain